MCTVSKSVLLSQYNNFRSEMPDYGDLLRIPEPRKVDTSVDEDSSYSVFISYVEIYNNFIYDLLEDRNMDSIKPRYSVYVEWALFI